MTRTSMSDLSYDIEQLYIEGHEPKIIAQMLECDISLVLAWIEEVNLGWEEAFPEVYSPFETVNS